MIFAKLILTCFEMLNFLFFYTKGERNGICILLALIFMMFAINFCMPKQSKEEQKVCKLQQQKDSVSSTLPASPKSRAGTSAEAISHTHVNVRPKVSQQTNFKRGSRPSSQTRLEKSFPRFNYNTVRIDINRADTTEWKRLKGIGSVLSKRIVKYRDKCGGFKSIEQLRKIYGLSEETYQSILPHLKMDSVAHAEKENHFD
jgi:competence ComEA-like helix-hairpin-helix protein